MCWRWMKHVYCLLLQAAQGQLAEWALTHPLHMQEAPWAAPVGAHPLHMQLSPWDACLWAKRAVLLQAAQAQLAEWALTHPLHRQLAPWAATRVQLLQAHPVA